MEFESLKTVKTGFNSGRSETNVMKLNKLSNANNAT
jgi:hypothetical protein